MRLSSIGGTTQYGCIFVTARKSNPDFQGETSTGCICSDGEYHLCLECTNTDCDITFDLAKRRGTRL